MAAVQMALTIGLPLLGAFLPFGLIHDWTPTKAALVITAALALLSLRGAYQLQSDNEVLLGDTHLQRLIVGYISEGNQLLRRLERKKSAKEVPRRLTDEIISWGGRAIRDLNEAAPDVADDLYAAHGTGPDTRVPKDQMDYVKSLLRGLQKIGRELR